MSDSLETKPVGRPLKFQSVEELQAKIDAYFREMDREEDTRVFAHTTIIDEDYDVIEKDVRVSKKRIICEACRRNSYEPGCKILSGELKLKRPYTVTGLALWLDTTRETLLDYQEKDEFSYTIVRAKQRIENYASERLFDKDTPTRGVIFSLSNNSKRWTEKSEVTTKSIDDLIKDQESSASNAG
jgi:hypothetical protein